MLRLSSLFGRKPTPPPVLMPVPPPLPRDNRDGDNDDEEVQEVTALGIVDMDAVPQRVRTLFRDPKYQPPTPPSVALELMALTRKNEVDFNAATDLFARDPMLASRVLKVARSPLYGAASVPTIRDAVVRLGSRRLNHVVLEAALEMRVFRSAVWGPWMDRVRRHSVAVGHIASHIAYVGCVDADQALVAGLVHDIGTAAAIGAVGDRHQEFKDLDPGALSAVFDEIHVEVGAIVADAWQMSSDIRAVVSGHHHIDKKTATPMMAIVVVAEAFAIDAGFGVHDPAGAHQNDVDPFVDDDLVWAKKVLELDDNQMRQLAKDLAPLIESF